MRFMVLNLEMFLLQEEVANVGASRSEDYRLIIRPIIF